VVQTDNEVATEVAQGLTPSMLSKAPIVVTGVGGFIGGFLACELARQGYRVIGTARDIESVPLVVTQSCQKLVRVVINGATDWSPVLPQSSAVIHCAAHVHVRRPSKRDLHLFRQVNVEGVRALSRGCRDHNVSLLLNLSSIAASALPTDEKSIGYGLSKHDAELVIGDVLLESNCRYVNLRLPAVYGPGAKGALGFLFWLVNSGLPLPLLSKSVKRSYLSVWNLLDCITHCLDRRPDRNVTVAIADDPALDLSELIRAMGKSARKSPRFIRLGAGPLALAALLAGRRSEFQRGMVEAVISSAEAHRALGWTPQVTAEEAWARMASRDRR